MTTLRTEAAVPVTALIDWQRIDDEGRIVAYGDGFSLSVLADAPTHRRLGMAHLALADAMENGS